MSNMRLFWEYDGDDPQNFSIYRSTESFTIETLPPVHKEKITTKEIYETVTADDHYYYMVRNGNRYSTLFDYKTLNYMFPVNIPVVNPIPIENVNGWTVTAGSLEYRANYFYGVGATLTFYQDIIIPSYLHPFIDNNEVFAKLSWDFGGWYNDSDYGYTTLSFLDNIGVVVKSLQSASESLYGDSNLSPRSLSSYIPPLARIIRIQCNGFRNQGTNLDAYWSNFKLSIDKDPYNLYNDFDNFNTSLTPLTWLKLDESTSIEAPKDYGSASHTVSYNNLSGITFNQKALRKGHKGSMGFSVNSNTNSKIQFLESSQMLNITKGSFTWFIFLQRTAANSQERLFGDNGDGVNKRVCWSSFDFPNNQRQANLRYLLNQPQFICITYNVQEKVYRLFTNGKWYNQTYVSPPGSTSGGQWMTLPQTSGYTHYGIRGYVSDFTWFNRSLTSLEVEKLYQLGKLE